MAKTNKLKSYTAHIFCDFFSSSSNWLYIPSVYNYSYLINQVAKDLFHILFVDHRKKCRFNSLAYTVYTILL